ncbi:Williams-Beuren syndrome chromosomal region 27 protein [Austrofundulus limnaeus]|uniref:Williams-Beuren syndrome chromosomal region 27 protein n=1 Tax=Austrofundulus limnaeus TaxID=52670 RepID=A0A2I4D4F9_AUSLI|nr:PREDICTED: Williams-Beuren syndrome chromosomal region 27 protein-like [Austrofundulus limnaeus]
MSDSGRNVGDVQNLFRFHRGDGSEKTRKFYNTWAESYEEDVKLLKYQGPEHLVDFLKDNFSGDPKELQVLDVACGSGLVAKLMSGLGFRVFVGVDCSEGMLEQAAQTGLYRDLKLALLGPEPLPAQTGGFICVAKGNHCGAAEEEYQRSLEREVQLMEEEGLWSRVSFRQVDRYMLDPWEDEETYISGSFYFYKKSSSPQIKPLN